MNEIMNYSITCLLFVLLISFTACNETEETPAVETRNATQEMVQELKSIAMNQDNIETWHLNRKRAIAMDEQLKTVTDPGTRINLLFRSGIEWLNAGDYNLAISRLGSIISFIEDNKIQVPANTLNVIKEVLGIAHLRKAELKIVLKIITNIPV